MAIGEEPPIDRRCSIPADDPPPAYESLLPTYTQVVQKISSNPKKFIGIYTILFIFLLLLCGGFLYHHFKTDSIDGKIDDLKTTHIDSILEKLKHLETRTKNMSQSMSQMMVRMKNYEAEIKVLHENMSRLAAKQNVEILPPTPPTPWLASSPVYGSNSVYLHSSVLLTFLFIIIDFLF